MGIGVKYPRHMVVSHVLFFYRFDFMLFPFYRHVSCCYCISFGTLCSFASIKIEVQQANNKLSHCFVDFCLLLIPCPGV